MEEQIYLEDRTEMGYPPFYIQLYASLLQFIYFYFVIYMYFELYLILIVDTEIKTNKQTRVLSA